MPARANPVCIEIRLRNVSPSRRELLDDLRRVAALRRGRPLTYQAYQQQGTYSSKTVAHRFGSWNAALTAAKLPICIDRDVPDIALFDNLKKVWRILGRQPTYNDLVKRNGVSRYAACAYEARFGSWNKALGAFAAHLDGKPAAPSTRLARQTRPRHRNPSPRRINAHLRSRILIRDGCQCRMCGTSPLKDPSVSLQVDHIVPWSKGGRTVANNLQTLCARCNVGKADLGA